MIVCILEHESGTHVADESNIHVATLKPGLSVLNARALWKKF